MALNQDDNDEETCLIPKPSSNDGEKQQKLKYPIPVYFIIGFEFFERYSHYTLQTILTVYCSTALGYSDDLSTAIFHIYIFVIYLFPLFGPILADGWIGNFKTIVIFSVIYLIGNVLITFGSAAEVIHIGLDARWTSFVGLFLNAVGTGVIKPCVSTFGGEQFTLPEQQSHLDRFFSVFIFVINLSSLLAMFISPILRHDIKCFGRANCYPLAYGVATASMAVAIVTLLVGYKTYRFRKREGNMLADVSKCVGHAICAKKRTKRDHWLDHADDKYDVTLIDDIKATLRVLVLFVPLPVYWALFMQLGSRWTLQATKMNGSMGFYTVKPEQMQVLNSVLMLVFIPMFDVCLYPLLGKCRLLRRPLQRLGAGMLLGALAFAMAALVERSLEPTYAFPPSASEGQLRLYNGFNCTIHVELSLTHNATEFVINPFDMEPILHIPVTQGQDRSIFATITPSIVSIVCADLSSWSGNITITRQEATSYLLTYASRSAADGLAVRRALPFDDVNKAFTGNPKIRIIYSDFGNASSNVTLTDKDDTHGTLTFNLDSDAYGTNSSEADSTSYWVTHNNARIADVELDEGGVYTLLVQPDIHTPDVYVRLFTVTAANSVPMYWLIPQLTVLTISEVLVSVTGLTFSFSQAPSRMKSLLTAAWLLTVAFGNLIVVFVAEVKIFKSQVNEYLLFAGLMLAVFLVFIFLSMRYKYVDNDASSKQTQNENERSGIVYNTFEDMTDDEVYS